MIRTLSGCMRASLALAAVIAAAVMVSGCGNSSTDPATEVPSPPAVKIPEAPQPPKPLKFTDLTLETKPTLVKDPEGPAFYSFSYQDTDGKVYKCKMPQAMADGEYTPEEWIRTFTLYRLPEVIKQKKLKKDANNDGVNDFPFIAPVPSTPTTAQPAGSPAPAPANAPAPRGGVGP